MSQALDLFALADLLTRPAGHPYVSRAVAVLRQLSGPHAGARG